MKRIKALLLAAGYGTRLRPLTLNTPKCLVEINGKPLLSYWLKKLEDLGCEEVLINTHYLSNKVIKFLETYKTDKLKIITSYEEEILGTAGTLVKHLDFFKNSTGLLIHADNFTTDNLTEFIKNHYLRPNKCIITMLTFQTENPSSCGIVLTDKEGKIIEFHEKSKKYYGNCANGALYAFDDQFIKFIRNLPSEIKDFSNDVIPLLIGKIYTWHTKQIYMDIGDASSLDKANQLAESDNYKKLNRT